MIPKRAGLSIVVAVSLVLVGCSASGGTSSGGAPTNGPTAPPVANLQPPAVATPTPEPSASPTAIPTANPSDVAEASPSAAPINPCSLLTQAEASTLIGVTLGPGKHQVVSPDTICTWAKGTTEVKVFLTAPTTPDAAKEYYDAHKAEIPPEAHITELPTMFDGAVIARGPTPIGTLSAIFVIHGSNFFEVYCGNPACTDASLDSGANLVAGRLP